MNEEELDLTNPEILRLKAEELLKEKQKELDKPVMEADVKKLLHELHVHQIELEMQNEALRQANETAQAALKKYTILYDLAPMGYLTLDAEGGIRELNFTAADILGEKRFSLIDSNFKLFISEDSLPVFNDFFSKVYKNNSKQSCEATLGHDKKFLCHVYMEGVVTDEDGVCLLSMIDISNFKR